MWALELDDVDEADAVEPDGDAAHGAVISVEGNHGELELLFVNPEVHSKGIGHAAWCLIEQLHSEVTVWGTTTPYFDKRNIHFYVNRCGFHMVEYFCPHDPAQNGPDASDDDDSDGMFRFRKELPSG